MQKLPPDRLQIMRTPSSVALLLCWRLELQTSSTKFSGRRSRRGVRRYDQSRMLRAAACLRLGPARARVAASGRCLRPAARKLHCTRASDAEAGATAEAAAGEHFYISVNKAESFACICLLLRIT